MSYTVTNFKPKKALKNAIKDYEAGAKAIRCFNPGLGPDLSNYTGTVYLEGPHYPEPHRWYCEAELVNGIVVKVKRNSFTQIKNVYYEKRRNKYRVSVRANGKRNFIGYFLTEKEANFAAQKFMKENHKEWYAQGELKDGVLIKVK